MNDLSIASAFTAIIGNERAKYYLTRLYQINRVGNSLLFAGPEGVGKGLFAKAFAKLLLGGDPCPEVIAAKIDQGNHPDLRIYHPEGKLALHSIDSLRQFSKEVFEAPFEAKKRIFIFHDAERMLPVSANALLKTFEEPSLDSIIILLSNSPEELLPTIRSRCRTLPFSLLSQQEISSFLQEKVGKNEESAHAIAALSHGSLGKALRLAQGNGEEMRLLILHLLAKGELKTHTELLQAIKEIVACLEIDNESKEESEEEDQLTAVQKEQLQKELEGALSLKKQLLAETIFEIILSWYRDQQLLREKGSLDLLFNRDSIPALKESVASAPSLDKVYQAIGEAQLSLQRSTALPMVLETLFLKLR